MSQQIKDDLVEFGVAAPSKIDVVHLGFDLSRFADDSDRATVRETVRERLGIPQDARVVTLIARVVKVKRVDRFLDMANLLADREDVWFLIAGDGDKRLELEAAHSGDRPSGRDSNSISRAVCFASDVVALTSDNEGTPVCLIEAQAAAVPVVTTEVGGVRTVVRDGETGRVVGTDVSELANAVGKLLENESLRQHWGRAGREHALASFSAERLVDDIEALYRSRLKGSSSYAKGEAACCFGGWRVVMCGIAGFETRAGATEARANALIKRLANRGPDGSWWQEIGAWAFAQTRLAVVDLSPEVRYPMSNEDGKLWLLFNGEVYNHRELRRDLERAGHRFRTACDAEVVLHGYEQWGDSAFSRLSGMWAIALLDRDTGELTLARDARGIKPLVMTTAPGPFAFASDALALVSAGLSLRGSRQRCDRGVRLLHYVPGPATGIAGVKTVEPGTVLGSLAKRR